MSKMLKLIVLGLFFEMSLIGHAQSGIHFESNLNWEQVKEKAKKGNKNILLVLYATWCLPCKVMEKSVYSNNAVGAYVNDHYVSAKVQVDTTNQDKEEIKTWYRIADSLVKVFHITAFPSYLFFSTEGEAVHIWAGALRDTAFLSLCENALNSEKQYFKLLQKFKSGIIDPVSALRLISLTTNMGNRGLAKQMAVQYKLTYLDTVSLDKLCTRDNLSFAKHFYDLVNSKDHFFYLFMKERQSVDSLMGEGFASAFIQFIISKEEIDTKIWRGDSIYNKNPDWISISRNIEVKYGKVYSYGLVLEGKIRFYKQTKNWSCYAREFDQKLKNSTLKKGANIGSDSWKINDEAWFVFQNCQNINVLRKALKWSELSIQLTPLEIDRVEYLDTKANLLYKLGAYSQAIRCEENAISLKTKECIRDGKSKGEIDQLESYYKTTLGKMKNGLPTWIINK